MLIDCLQCGTPFDAKRNDAQFCSPACRKASSRLANLSVNGVLIRGQHEGDVPPTNLGIEKGTCLCCGGTYSRWFESKLARLVRNEMEGSIHWDTRKFDQEVFNKMKAVRMQEWRFCSDECQAKGPQKQPLKTNQKKETTIVPVATPHPTMKAEQPISTYPSPSTPSRRRGA